MINQSSGVPKTAIIKRIVIYGLLIFILSVAQCSFFTNLDFLKVTPNIIVGAIAAIALCDSQKTACICAISAGFLIDALSGSGISVSPIALFAVALISCEISKKLLRNFLTWIAVLIPAILTDALFSLAYLYLEFERFSLSTVIKGIMIPEMIYTAIFSLPLFFIVKPCSRLANSKNKFKV